MSNDKPHLGQNIAKLRGLRRMTQKEMAGKLNLGQPEYSKIEKKAVIDDNLLSLVAGALEVTPEAIKNLNESAVINNISCTFNDNNFNTINQFSPIDKIVEVTDANKDLYERLLVEKEYVIQTQKEIIEMYKKQQKAS